MCFGCLSAVTIAQKVETVNTELLRVTAVSRDVMKKSPFSLTFHSTLLYLIFNSPTEVFSTSKSLSLALQSLSKSRSNPFDGGFRSSKEVQ